MTLFSRNMLLAALCVSALFGVTRPAQANITITPTIVTIEGRERYADVSLINTSNETKTYALGWRFFKMAEGTGAYETTQQSVTDFDLTKSLIYSPKRVTLGPGASQKIRLALRLSGEPPAPGDYRAHLEFTQATEKDDTNESTAKSGEKGKAGVGVGVNVAFSIPVIYRVGTPDVTISMDNVSTQLNTKSKKLEAIIPVTRNGGPYGLSGELSVYHTAKGGKETMIGQVKNANIFPEAGSRIFKIALKTNQLEDGSLRVVLKDSDRSKNIIYAEKIIPIGSP
jgi:fimbrial chaperone protein